MISHILAFESKPKIKDDLTKSIKILYQSSIGELIYAMSTCPPDIKHRRPSPSPTELHGFVDRDWAAYLQTQQSSASTCSHLLGECIGCHTQLLPTVPHSSTDGECMAACSAKQMILFVQRDLWDLWVPQAAATLPYQDTDAMENTQTTPLPRTRHMGS